MRFIASILLAAATAQAHYTFPRIVVNGVSETADWSATRETKNYQSKMGVTEVSSPDIRCYQQALAQQVETVAAGSVIHYVSSQQINHPGPTQYYMAKVPDGESVKTWDGSGSVWFKIFSTGPPTVDANKQQLWPGQNEYVTVNATVPTAVPSGQYLIRVEQIALHLAMQANGAQFYLSCSQVSVTGGGSGTPGPLVAFPGAYKANDPGILVNINTMQAADYKPPGPAVWTGA